MDLSFDFFMQLPCTTKGWKFEFWQLVTVMCKKHLQNIGNFYWMTQNNSPEGLNFHKHLYEGFRSCIQVVVMYLLGCFSAPTEGILLKIHILGTAHFHYRWHKFGCDWSIHKGTSLKEQFIFFSLRGWLKGLSILKNGSVFYVVY